MTARPTDSASHAIAAGEHARAIATLRTALRRDPADTDALSLLTTACLRAGDAAGAEGSAQRLVQLMPGDFRAWHNLGNTLLHFGNPRDAEAPLLRAHEGAPRDTTVLLALSNLYAATDRWTLSQQVCREGLAIAEHDTRFLVNLAIALHGAGRIEDALPLATRACEQSPARLDHADALAAMSTYAPGMTAEEAFSLHARYGRLLESATTPMPARPTKTRPGPVTVGLLSADLRDHAVAKFVLPILKHADPGAVRFIAYSLAAREDAWTDALRPHCHAWRHVPFLPHAALAHRIRSDSVDVLLDLSGHTRGHRLPVLALRPTPAQATWMGYPNTTGLTRVDARITDSASDPADTASCNTEHLIHVDPCLVAFPRPAVAPSAPRPAGAPISFVSFSSMLKLNDALIRTWSAVLARVPGSTLTLKHHALADDGVRDHLGSRFAAAGLASDRLRLERPSPTSDGVLPAYHAADIALDTFPYAGTTTTCEALSMGVPVVTRAGETSASRVGRSLLAAAGLPELCAPSEETFIASAAGLALDAQRLASTRARLQGSYSMSPLADAAGFARRMSAVLAGLATHHRA